MSKHYLAHIEITHEIIRDFIIYEQETGKLFWKERSEKWFKPDGCNGSYRSMRIWNGKYSGKEAFTSVSKSHGYLEGAILGKGFLAHRVIWCYMTGEWPEYEIDHKNGVPTDNSWNNLRSVNSTENSQNQKIRCDNTTGVRGVRWVAQRKRFYAAIKINKVHLHLGCYKNLDDAKSARNIAERKYGFHDRNKS